MGILPQDGLGSQRLDPSRGPVGPGFRLDLLDQLRDPLPVLLRGQVRPAGKLRQHKLLLLGVLEAPEVLPPIAGGILLCPVEPQSLEGLAPEDRLGEVGAGSAAPPGFGGFPQPVRVSPQPIDGWLKPIGLSSKPIGARPNLSTQRLSLLMPCRNLSATRQRPSALAETYRRPAEVYWRLAETYCRLPKRHRRSPKLIGAPPKSIGDSPEPIADCPKAIGARRNLSASRRSLLATRRNLLPPGQRPSALAETYRHPAEVYRRLAETYCRLAKGYRRSPKLIGIPPKSIAVSPRAFTACHNPSATPQLLDGAGAQGESGKAGGLPERKPRSRAKTIACARVQTPSLSKRLETWLRTVLSLIPSRSAISAFANPSLISPSTSRSRGDSAAKADSSAARSAPSRD